MTQPLTTTERLALQRLARAPESAVTRTSFATIIGLSPPTAGGILNRLVEKGYAARTPAKKNTRFWKLRDYQDDLSGPEHTSTRILDDSIATLQAQAARAQILEEVLHDILNLLAEAGIQCPHLENGAEQ